MNYVYSSLCMYVTRDLSEKPTKVSERISQTRGQRKSKNLGGDKINRHSSNDLGTVRGEGNW